PVANWIKACDLMLGLDVDTVVPGHGPITDKRGIAAVKGYFEYVLAESRKRYAAGMPVEQAARDIALDRFADWIDPERIVVNVAACYRDFRGEAAAADMLPARAAMARLYFERKAATRSA